jgi:hypothetical protein
MRHAAVTSTSVPATITTGIVTRWSSHAATARARVHRALQLVDHYFLTGQLTEDRRGAI